MIGPTGCGKTEVRSRLRGFSFFPFLVFCVFLRGPRRVVFFLYFFLIPFMWPLLLPSGVLFDGRLDFFRIVQRSVFR